MIMHAPYDVFYIVFQDWVVMETLSGVKNR